MVDERAKKEIESHRGRRTTSLAARKIKQTDHNILSNAVPKCGSGGEKNADNAAVGHFATFSWDRALDCWDL